MINVVPSIWLVNDRSEFSKVSEFYEDTVVKELKPGQILHINLFFSI